MGTIEKMEKRPQNLTVADAAACPHSHARCIAQAFCPKRTLLQVFVRDHHKMQQLGPTCGFKFLCLPLSDNRVITLTTTHNLPYSLEVLRLRLYTIFLILGGFAIATIHNLPCLFKASIASQTVYNLTNIMHKKQISICCITGHLWSILPRQILR